MNNVNELYHYGVKGMRWGIRRSKETLGRKVDKLTKRNQSLSDSAKRLDSKARYHESKSSKVAKNNSKYEARLTKATAKKAKYDYKLNKQLAKTFSSEKKIGKYTRKSAKQQAKILKAQMKIKYNKHYVKSEEIKQAAKECRQKIEKNESMIRMYNNTIKGIDSGKIKQGRVFMQYVKDAE